MWTRSLCKARFLKLPQLLLILHQVHWFLITVKKKTMIKRQLREKHFLQRKTRVMMTTGNLFQRFQANNYPFEVVCVASTKI